MRSKVLASIVFVLAGLLTAEAQSLKIVYDFNTDNFTFYRVKAGKPDEVLSYPVLRKNEMIHLEVVNFNKFVYSANCSFSSEDYVEDSDVSFMSLLTPIVMPGSSQSFFSALGGDASAGVRGGLMSDRSAKAAYDDVTDAYTELYDLESVLRNIDYAITKLNDLRYNPYLPTDTIQAMSDQLIHLVFQKQTVNPSDFASYTNELTNQYRENTAQLSTATSHFMAAYSSYANEHPGENFIGKELGTQVSAMSTSLDQFSSNMSLEDLTSKLNTLENLYTAIKSTTFKFNTSHMAEGDQINLTMSFYENPKNAETGEYEMASLSSLESLTKVRTKQIKILTRDLKFTTSVGFGFPYFTNNVGYINRDSVITTQQGNNFSPNLSAFLNFYPYSGRNVNFGGTFGVGVPLTDQTRTVNMFIGVSTVFGTDNRIAIHAGAAVGQVKSLDQGYKVNDMLPTATTDVPTRNTWDIGGFFGISFKLSGSSNTQ